MDAAHLHLVLNHFPIAGIVFAIPLLIVSWRLKSEHLKRAALLFVVVSGLFAISTFLTGEPAEDLIKQMPGASEQLVKAHEEAAETSLISICVAAFVALVGLFVTFKRKAVPAWVIPAVTVLTLVSGGLFAWSNNLGGKIRHTEIRSGGQMLEK